MDRSITIDKRAITVLAISALAMVIFFSQLAAAPGMSQDDAGKNYKAKCAMCHSPKAEKSYNPDLPKEEQVAAILKGRQAAKPPHMPAFEPKGMKEDQAKALVEYMVALRKPAN